MNDRYAQQGRYSRRGFLSNVGGGMLVAGLGSQLAADLGIGVAVAEDASRGDKGGLTFGSLEPLVDLMQQTPVEKLQPTLMQKIKSGTELKTLVAAGALANARCFAGHDYIGFHTMMALMPAWEISRELPKSESPLPVLKVLLRNTTRMQATGRRDRMTASPSTRAIKSVAVNSETGGRRLLKAMSTGDLKATEQTFGSLLAAGKPVDAYNDLQHIVQDAPDVHRVALAWRAWETLELTGYDHAQTLLRQSVRYCVDREQGRLAQKRPAPPLRKLVPKLLDEHKLLSRTPSARKADDAWIAEMGQTIFSSSREQAAGAVAAALAEGYQAEDIGHAMSVAANLLVLHDPGRRPDNVRQGKPKDSVHGDSVGVHASDAANAWRHIARVTNRRNRICSLIVGAWHTAGRKSSVNDEVFAYESAAKELKSSGAKSLVTKLSDAVQARDQLAACAAVRAAESAGHSPKPIFDSLRRYAVSEDGALHSEKYFRTVTEEFASSRDAFRWRQLIGLARVTASQYGWPAPGRDQARKLVSGS